MPEQKRMMTILGKEMEVSDVPIAEMKEPVCEYTLEDGSVLRVRNVATAVLRLEGQFNPDGTPIYLVLTSPNVAVQSSKISQKK
jgi:hypothetical protein